jgi:hypothetical protein
LREGSSDLEKEHVVYNGECISICWHPDKEIPSRRECLLSAFSLLLSVTKTQGKDEKAFQVAVTLLVWHQPHVIFLALKPKNL